MHIGNSMGSKKKYTNERTQQMLIYLLKAHNIKKVIASPGTTNLTFVASLQYDSFFEIYSAADERSAAYMACGLATASGEPVVLTCTGATASRNYLPGLTEAFYRKLPILAVTAHVGRFKIGHLFPQVIDRRSISNDVVKKSFYLPVIKDDDDEWINNVNINDALLELKHNGNGPVHLDLSSSFSMDFSIDKLPSCRVIDRITHETEFPHLSALHIGVFVGSHRYWTKSETDILDRFCEINNAVVLCDHTSNYKGKYRILFSLVASQLNYRTHLLDFDVLIHIGEVSGDYYTQSLYAKEVWRVSEDGEIRDKFRTLRYVFQMSEQAFFKYYTLHGIKKNKSFVDDFNNLNSLTYEKIPELPFSNIWIASKSMKELPENSEIHFGILHSLRSWNFFDLPCTVSSSSNVGGFGIDGCVSTLIGSALAQPQKLFFGVFGDLAFFYDMNVLGNHHLSSNIRIMLINNGRGTEFRNFDHPGSLFGDNADKYIAAAGHYGNKSINLVKHYAQDLNFEYRSASTKDEYLMEYKWFFSKENTSRPKFFEIFTESKDESDSEKIIRSILKQDQRDVNIKQGIKSIVKTTVGPKGIKIINVLRGRL